MLFFWFYLEVKSILLCFNMICIVADDDFIGFKLFHSLIYEFYDDIVFI